MIVIYGSGSKSPSVMLYKTNNFPLLKTFLQDEFKTPFLGGTLVSSIHNNHERKFQSNKLSDLVIKKLEYKLCCMCTKYKCICP